MTTKIYIRSIDRFQVTIWFYFNVLWPTFLEAKKRELSMGKHRKPTIETNHLFKTTTYFFTLLCYLENHCCFTVITFQSKEFWGRSIFFAYLSTSFLPQVYWWGQGYECASRKHANIVIHPCVIKSNIACVVRNVLLPNYIQSFFD